MLSSLTSSSQPSFLEGTSEPLPYPGRYEQVLAPLMSVIKFPKYARTLTFSVGNPVSDTMGTMAKIRLVGSDKHPMAAAQAPARSRMRFARMGLYVRDPEGVGNAEAWVDQDVGVHAKCSKDVTDRISATVAATAAAKGERRNRFVARAHYKGDSYSLGVRASSGPSFGASGLASVTQNLALGGEAYFRSDMFLRRSSKGVPAWLCWSATSLWRQSDWMASLQYSQMSKGLVYASFLRAVGDNVKLGTQLLVRPVDAKTQVTVGGSMAFPLTKSVVKCAVQSTGKLQSSWERRLLSTVRLQVTGDIDMFAHRISPQQAQQAPGITAGNRFAVNLQIGYVPPATSEWSPVLVAWVATKDLTPMSYEST